MPTFEMVLLIRKLERAHLKDALKRGANYIFERGGTLRSIENLGFRNLPYMIEAKGKGHIHAHCFVLNFDVGPEEPRKIREKFRLDLDVVRSTSFLKAQTVLNLHKTAKPQECTAYLDVLPPPYRPNVIALQEMAKKKIKKPAHKNYEDTDYLIY